MSLEFEIKATKDSSRRGTLLTPHGRVETPVFMPVGTQATVKGISQDILEDLGVHILLGNTYHLYLRPGIDQVRSLGGLYRFMSWKRGIRYPGMRLAPRLRELAIGSRELRTGNWQLTTALKLFLELCRGGWI